MVHSNPLPSGDVPRRTLRLTFTMSDSGLNLVSVEGLEMITPPQPGLRPAAGTNGGHWFELRDDSGRVLAHRLIDPNVLDSVEVHSPDGTINREFGATRTGVFEVLLPDIEEANRAVLVGTPLLPSRSRTNQEATSGDIASFDLY